MATSGYLIGSEVRDINNVIINSSCCFGNERNDSENATDSLETEIVIIFLTIELVLMITSLGANGLVLMAFSNNRHLRSNVTNFYLLQLSLANFLMGVVSVLHIVAIIDPSTLSNDYGCLSRYATMLVVCGYSSLSLLAISYDRFLAIAGPLYYRTRICKRRVLIHCVLIYSIPSVLFILVPFIWKDTLEPNEQCTMLNIFRHKYLAFIVIPFYLIITTVLVLLFVVTVYLNRRRMHSIQKLVVSMPFNWKRNSAHKRSGRLTKTSGLVLASFLLCWLPFFINLMVQVYGGVDNSVMYLVSMVAFLPILFNSALTPVLYVYRLATFRSAIKKIFCRDQYLQEKQEYETTRLLQRRNAIRHIRESYDSANVLNSVLFTSQISDESEFETSISDIPEYEYMRPTSSLSRRHSGLRGELWVNEPVSYPYAMLENGNICGDGHLMYDPQNLTKDQLITDENAVYAVQNSPKLLYLGMDGSIRRHSSPSRKPNLQTIPQNDLLGPVVIEGETRRGSSPEFRGQNTYQPLCLCPQISEQRRSSRDLYNARKKSYGVLQDIPEGSALESCVIAEKDEYDDELMKELEHPQNIQFARDPNVRRGSSPTLNRSDTKLNRSGERRTSSPHVMSHYDVTNNRTRLSAPDVTRSRSHTIGEADRVMFTKMNGQNKERKNSLPPVPFIVIDDHDEIQSKTVASKNQDKTTSNLSDQSESGLNAAQAARHTSTGTEHTASSENSCDNLLVQSGDILIAGTSYRRKSSILQEITAPIARRLSALFKTIDTHKESNQDQESSSRNNSKKLRLKQRLFGRGSVKDGGDWETGGASSDESSPSGSRKSLDKALQDVMKKDATVVLELLEELEDLLQEDQCLSSLVLNDLKRRAEQAMILSQQNKKRRGSSLRQLFLGTNDVTFDTSATPHTPNSRRSTFCGTYELHNGNQSNDAVYTIPYEGKRKQKSLAHIFNNNFHDRTTIPMSALNLRNDDGGKMNGCVPTVTCQNCNEDSDERICQCETETSVHTGEKLTGYSHAPLGKCVQMPLADTLQMTADIQILSQINGDNHDNSENLKPENNEAQKSKQDTGDSETSKFCSDTTTKDLNYYAQNTQNENICPHKSYAKMLHDHISQSPHTVV